MRYVCGVSRVSLFYKIYAEILESKRRNPIEI